MILTDTQKEKLAKLFEEHNTNGIVKVIDIPQEFQVEFRKFIVGKTLSVINENVVTYDFGGFVNYLYDNRTQGS
jgi:hypothetical protein